MDHFPAAAQPLEADGEKEQLLKGDFLRLINRQQLADIAANFDQAIGRDHIRRGNHRACGNQGDFAALSVDHPIAQRGQAWINAQNAHALPPDM